MPIYRANGNVIYFAHIPKCGGSSVEAMMGRAFGAPAFLRKGFRPRPTEWTASSPQHVAAADLAKLFPASFFDASVALVRNPVARLASAFRFQRDAERRIAKDATFGSWLQSIFASPDRRAEEFDNHTCSQLAFLPEGTKVFRIEDQLEDFTTFLQKFLPGDAPTLSLPHKNRARKAAPVDITADDTALIERACADEFEAFGYPVTEPVAPTAPAVVPPRTIAIKLPVPTARRMVKWGEYFFAEGLSAAFGRRGIDCRILNRRRWADGIPGQADLFLRRSDSPIVAAPDVPAIAWILYGNDPVTEADATGLRHIFVASDKRAKELSAEASFPVSSLLQGFDADRMSPDGPAIPGGPLFVANSYRKRLRRTVRNAIEQDVKIDLYGSRWAGGRADHLLRGESVPNAQLAEYYRGAAVVLNDHEHGMGHAGFISNRIFDVVACGAPLLSDPIVGLPNDMATQVSTYDEDADFADMVTALREEGPSRRAERRDFALAMRDTHSFDQRVEDLLAVL